MRVERRKQPRSDWAQWWKSAGGKFYGGRMIAPKNSPIWVRLNKTFGTPYPPFDWGSGMGVLDVSRREAIRLGVITDEEIKREVADLREKEKSESLPSMNGNLQATVPATQEVFNKMRADFGDLADVVRVNDAVEIKRRPPDRVIKIGGDKFLAECDAFDGDTYMMQIWINGGTPKLWAFFRMTMPTSKKLGRT